MGRFKVFLSKIKYREIKPGTEIQKKELKCVRLNYRESTITYHTQFYTLQNKSNHDTDEYVMTYTLYNC